MPFGAGFDADSPAQNRLYFGNQHKEAKYERDLFLCQTPFTLSMEQKIAALRKMHAENLHHYDARCPRCGRANAISRERLEMFTPGWEEAIKGPRPHR